MKPHETVPQGWKKTTLGEISKNVMYGMNVKATNYDGIHKYIRITDINEETNKFSPSPLTSPDGLIDKKYKLLKGDLVFARTGASVGKSYLFNENDGEVYFAGFLIRFHIFSQNPFFIFYQTQTLVYWDWVKSISMRSGQPGINAEEFKKLSIILPPLPEQHAIAELLCTWDTAIEKTQALIEAKERQFRWLLHTLISKQSPLNTQWKKVKLGIVCNITKGQQLNLTHMKCDGKYYALNGGVYPSGTTDNWNTQANTISISEGGNSCGYVNYNTENFWSGGHCYTLLNLKKNIDKYYLYFYLKMNEKNIMNLRVGSGLPNIQKKDINNFMVKIPPLPEQQRIANILNNAQKEIELLKNIAEQYKKQKKGLMQKLLTGQWRLKPKALQAYETHAPHQQTVKANNP